LIWRLNDLQILIKITNIKSLNYQIIKYPNNK
jgi:hypothetical protein